LKTQAHLDAARKRYGKGYKSRMAKKKHPRAGDAERASTRR